MTSISIKLKLWGVFAFFFVFYVVTWALTYQASSQINEYLDVSKIEAMRQADALRQALRDVEELVNDAAQIKETDIVLEADVRADALRSALTSLKALDTANREEYERTAVKFELYYRNARAAAMILIREGTFNRDVLIHAEKVRQTLPGLREEVENILNRNYDSFSNFLNRSTVMASKLVRKNSLILFLLLIVSSVAAPLIIRRITNPIAKLVHATGELAKGNLDVQAEVTSHDEIGNLVVSFNEMTRALKEKSEALERTTEELKIANSELQEADRLKSEFLATMSHELRTPLNAIINFSEQVIEDWQLIPEDKEWSDDALDMLKRVQKSSKHLLSMINDLLDLAKIESGHVELNLVVGNIGEVVAEAVASVSSLAKTKNLEISHWAAEKLPDSMFDERKILQVLINLISNSIKFTDHGSIRVEADEAADRKGIIVKVIDTGIGIEKKNHSMIFDRFRQADGADSRIYKGTGLGLNLVKELVELHGGSIRVDSKKGKGSTFVIYLPKTPPGGQPAKTKE